MFQSQMWRKASNCSMKWKKGVAPSEVTYSITITACGNGGQWRSKALELWMSWKKGLSINLITHNSAITAMSKAAKQSSRVIMEVGSLDKSSRTLVTNESRWYRTLMALVIRRR
jgi:hypothetical protein